MVIVTYTVLCFIQNILTSYISRSSIFVSAIVTTRSIRPTAPNQNINGYYEPTNNRQLSPPDDWEPGLREATYQAILRERNYHQALPQLRDDIARAPLLNKYVQTTSFGDIAALARGQLYGNSRIGLTFAQDRCASAYLPRDGGITGNSDLLAVWSVKRIRHRDNGLYRYEMEYTISPINSVIREDLVARNGRFNYDVPGHVFIVKSTHIDKEYKYISDKYRKYLPAAHDHRGTSSSIVAPTSVSTKHSLDEQELYQQLIDTLHKKTTHRFGSTIKGTTAENIGLIRESLPLPTLPTIKDELIHTAQDFVIPLTTSTVPLVPTTKAQFRPSTGVPTRPTTTPTVVTYVFDGISTKPRSTSPMTMYFTNAIVLPVTKEMVRPTEVYFEQQSTLGQGSTNTFEPLKTTISSYENIENYQPTASTFEDVKPTRFGTTYEAIDTPTVTKIYGTTIKDILPTTYGAPIFQTSTKGYHYSTPTYRPSFTEFIRPTIYGSSKPFVTTIQDEGTPFYVTPETVGTTPADDLYGSTFKGLGPYSTTITLQPAVITELDNSSLITVEGTTQTEHEVPPGGTTQFSTNKDRYFPTNTPHFITVPAKTTDAITGYPFVNKVPPFFDEDIDVFPENKLEKPAPTTEAVEHVSTTTPGPFLIEENYNAPNKIDIPDEYNIFGVDEEVQKAVVIEEIKPTVDTKEIDEVFGTLPTVVEKTRTNEDFKQLFGQEGTTESTSTSKVRVIYSNFFEASTTIAPTEEMTTQKQFETTTNAKITIEPTKSTNVEEFAQTSQSVSTSITFEINLKNNKTLSDKKDSSEETLQAIESIRKNNTNKKIVFRKKKISTGFKQLRPQKKPTDDLATTTEQNLPTSSSLSIATNDVFNGLALSVVNNAKGIDYLQDVTTIRPIKKLKYRRKLHNLTIVRKPIKSD